MLCIELTCVILNCFLYLAVRTKETIWKLKALVTAIFKANLAGLCSLVAFKINILFEKLSTGVLFTTFFSLNKITL